MNRRNSKMLLAGGCSLAVLIGLVASCQRVERVVMLGPESVVYEPASETIEVPSNPLREAYFGETHMHTAFSLDAYIGGTRLMPDDAYRFAKGEEVVVDGVRHSIGRPLDFAALSDHAEYIGEMYSTMTPGARGHDEELLQQLRGLETFEDKDEWFLAYVVKNNRGLTPQHPEFYAGPATVVSAWQMMMEAAERHDDPGTFSTIPAFEWSGAPEGANLHRNVLFRDANVPTSPVSYIDVNREDGLWEWMADLEQQGMQLFAIPHNSNASKGMMFSGNDAQGDPIDLEYAQLREHFEPLIEIMQIKGNSEVHRNFWSADEFADFENADSLADYSGRALDPKNYVRHGIIEGLAHEKRLEANPYKLGFVGGTDNHNGLSSDVAEDDFIGGHGPADGTVERRRAGEVGGWALGKDLNPGALTGVWAERNTRAAIWDAMRARETFATSGPRMKLRFFAGHGLPQDPKDALMLVEQGYERGVPMGATLGTLEGPPTFTVWAIQDPEGAPLDRIQIVKGWVDAEGAHQERIIDVVWSDKRLPDADGKLPAVGNTVDLTTATYTHDIGSAELLGGWTDWDFDPKLGALYYARVIEIPTPRWSTYDAVRSGQPLLEDRPTTIQERAWSSPIWTTPAS